MDGGQFESEAQLLDVPMTADWYQRLLNIGTVAYSRAFLISKVVRHHHGSRTGGRQRVTVFGSVACTGEMLRVVSRPGGFRTTSTVSEDMSLSYQQRDRRIPS